MDRYLIHCDMNNYFASVEMLDNPYLEFIPIVVCGEIELRHGIVLSKNNKAREYGIITGESIYEAKEKCKDLVCVKANYQKYLKYTKLSREIYKRYSELIYPYGLDEAWIDVTKLCNNIDDAIKIAREIKYLIKTELKLNIAVGVSFNYIFAKLGSDQKSDDVFVIDKENFEKITEYMPAFNLLFVGAKTRSTLKKLNILTIGDLRKTNPIILKQYLGKKGLTLYEFANGNDSEFNPVTQADEEIKSISNTITSPKDILTFEETEAFIYILSEVTSKRLIKHNLSGRTIALTIKYNDFTSVQKQKTFDNNINLQSDIYNMASYILTLLEEKKPIRSVSLRISQLSSSKYTQLTLFTLDIDSEAKKLYKSLQKKYGNISLEKSSNLRDWDE